MIKGLQTRMAILGHIKIGGKKKLKKGNREVIVPEKYDHFVVTTTEQDELGYLPDDSLTQKLMTDQLNMLVAEHTEKIYNESGELVDTIQTISTEDLNKKNPTLKRILVALPFDDPEKNLVTSLALYDRDGCRCRGDGETADYVDPRTGEFTKVPCPCNMFMAKLNPADDPQFRPDHQFAMDDAIREARSKKFNCKANGNLRIMIAKAKTLGGIHQFRTTSLNSITQLMAAMHQVSEITGGFLSAIPMLLEISSKKVSTGPNKPPRTVYVVTLTHRASINDFLREVAEQTALRESMRKQIAAKEILELPPPGQEDPVEQKSIAQEFYSNDFIGDVEAEYVQEEPPKGMDEQIEEATREVREAAQSSEEASETTEPLEEKKARDETSEPNSEPSPKQKNAEKKEESSNEETQKEEEASLMPKVSIDPQDDADMSKATKEMRKEFFKKARDKYSDDQIRGWLIDLWNIQSSSKLLTWQVTAMMEAID